MTTTIPEQIEHLDFDPTLPCESGAAGLACRNLAEFILRFTLSCQCGLTSAVLCKGCLHRVIGAQSDPTVTGRCKRCKALHGAKFRHEWLIINGWEPIR